MDHSGLLGHEDASRSQLPLNELFIDQGPEEVSKLFLIPMAPAELGKAQLNRGEQEVGPKIPRLVNVPPSGDHPCLEVRKRQLAVQVTDQLIPNLSSEVCHRACS
jgi:hypothetical protein